MSAHHCKAATIVPKRIVVFLDVDGILHSTALSDQLNVFDPSEQMERCKGFVNGSLRPEDFGLLTPEKQTLLADVLERHPEVVLVLSSAWRNWQGHNCLNEEPADAAWERDHVATLNWLKPLLHPLLAERLMGKTPLVPHSPTLAWDRLPSRLDEIRQYMHVHGHADDLAEHWIAIDDQARHFSALDDGIFHDLQGVEAVTGPFPKEAVLLIDGMQGLTAATAAALDAALIRMAAHQQGMFDPAAATASCRKSTGGSFHTVSDAPVIGAERTPVPWKADDAPLNLGADGAFFGLDNVHPEDLRNVMVLGETGSGKTVSAVVPYLNAAVSYHLADGRPGFVFIADPKRELRNAVEMQLRQAGTTHRLVVLGEKNLPVRFFAVDCTLGMADRRQKIEAFLPFGEFGNGSHAYWHENSMTKLYALFELQARAAAARPGARLFNQWARALSIPPCGSRNSWVLLKVILQHLCEGGSKRVKAGKIALQDTCKYFGISGPETTVLDMYAGSEDASTQFMYIVTCATPLLGLMTDECLLKYVELDPVPDPQCDAIDIMSLVEQGKVLLIQPENKESARLAAKVVKGKVHEAVFTRRDQERPVFTVVDEFQRFVSNDPETGEQAYLDRCRGYRGLALYATQTLASLKHALGSDNAAQTAVDILLANTPTKIVMRTTDSSTLDWLRAVLPGPPLPGPHVVDVHRPIALRGGQGYLIQANGSWGLRQACPAALQTSH